MSSHAPQFIARANSLLNRHRCSRAQRLAESGRLAPAHRLYARAAKSGHVEAQYRLGLAYMRGVGCPRSGNEALRWLQLAAEGGHREAQFELGVLLLTQHDAGWWAGPSARWLEGKLGQDAKDAELLFPTRASSTRDDERAFLWLSRAAEAGRAEAQANLGWLLLKGVGCTADRPAARRWLLMAAEHDISQAAFGLAELFGDDQAQEYDEAQSHSWLKKAADLGNASAAHRYGRILREAGGDDNLVKAARYFSVAVEKKHLEAAFELGSLMLVRAANGADAERAAEHLRSAAKGGHIGSALLLGELYSRGEKLKPDLREAACWFRIAADAGHVQAQFQIGCLYARGDGVSRDLSHAARYFEMSAEGGHLIGAINIGIFYETGDGVPKDEAKAADWLRVAADGGVPQAQVRLTHLLRSRFRASQGSDDASELFERTTQSNSAEAEFALAQTLIAKNDHTQCERINELLVRAISKQHIAAAELALNWMTEGNQNATTARAALNLIRTAVEAGSAHGMVVLARQLLSGRYANVDSDRAELLLKRAAETGDQVANFELGVFYCMRKKLPNDIAQGLRHYIRAAELGHPTAQYNAGVMLLNPAATERDLEQAAQFLAEAAAQGMSRAQDVLEEVTKKQMLSRKTVGVLA